MISLTSRIANCRACGSPETESLFRIEGRSARRCLECTHVYLDVVHDPDSIRGLYANYGNGGQNTYFEGIDEEVVRSLDSYLARCEGAVRLPPKQVSLLDIGCGNGTLLSRALARGFTVAGIEISPPLAAEASRRAGCTVYEQFLTELDLPEASFDVVTMYDLIEHLQDPQLDLRQVFRVLKPGGVFFALTPNDEALVRRVSRCLYSLSFRLFEGPLRRLYYPDHLSYFTAESLARLLRGVGFELVSLDSVNQELSRLRLSPLERIAVRMIFGATRCFKNSGGKLTVFARKPLAGSGCPGTPM